MPERVASTRLAVTAAVAPRSRCNLLSAVSKDILVQRFQAFASEVLVHPVHELIGRQRPIRLDDGPFAVEPPRLDRVEPGAFHRQAAHQDPDPAGALHPAVMRPNPRPHRSTDVPSGALSHTSTHTR